MLGSSGSGVPVSGLGDGSDGSKTLMAGITVPVGLGSTAVVLASTGSSPCSRSGFPRFLPTITAVQRDRWLVRGGVHLGEDR